MRSSYRGLAVCFVAASVGLGLSTVRPSLALQAPATPPASQDSQEPTIRVNVELVNIFFTVKAKKGGQLIPNLQKEDFTIYEDGKQQTIQYFSRETDLPLTLGLLIDISASQERLIATGSQAAAAFFSSALRNKAAAFLISF